MSELWAKTTTPFAWVITKAGQVLVSRDGRPVATIAGADAVKLIERLGDGAERDQSLIARATGNYRRGNERH